jgi:hypothetical protein
MPDLNSQAIFLPPATLMEDRAAGREKLRCGFRKLESFNSFDVRRCKKQANHATE